MEGSQTRTTHTDSQSEIFRRGKPHLVRRSQHVSTQEDNLVTRRRPYSNERTVVIDAPAGKASQPFVNYHNFHLARFARKASNKTTAEDSSKPTVRPTRSTVVPDQTTKTNAESTSELATEAPNIVETPTKEKPTPTDEATTTEAPTPTEEETTTTEAQNTPTDTKTPEDSSTGESTKENTNSTEGSESPSSTTSETSSSATEDKATTEGVMPTSGVTPTPTTPEPDPFPTTSSRTRTTASQTVSRTSTTTSPSTETTATETITETPTTSSKTKTTSPATTSEEVVPTPETTTEATAPADSPTVATSADTEAATTSFSNTDTPVETATESSTSTMPESSGATTAEVVPTPSMNPDTSKPALTSEAPGSRAKQETKSEEDEETSENTPIPTPTTSATPTKTPTPIPTKTRTPTPIPDPVTSTPETSSQAPPTSEISSTPTSSSQISPTPTASSSENSSTPTSSSQISPTPTTSSSENSSTPTSSSQISPTPTISSSEISPTPTTSSSLAPITPTDSPTTSSTTTNPPDTTSSTPSFTPISTTASDEPTPTPTPTTTTYPSTLVTTTSFTSSISSVQTVTVTNTPIPTQSSVCVNYGLKCDTNAQCVVLAGTPTCVCNPGFVGNGTQCREVDCSTCPDGTYQSSNCTGTADRVCTACTATNVCLTVAAQCSPSANTICQTCSDPSKVGPQCQLNLLWVTTSQSYSDVTSNYAAFAAGLMAAAGASSADMQSVNVTSGPPTLVYVGFARPYDRNLLAAVNAGDPQINQLGITQAQEYGQTVVVNPTTNGSSGGISVGAIAGIACGIVAVLLLFCLGVFLVRRRRQANIKPTARDVEAVGAAKPPKKPDGPIDPNSGYSAMIPLTATPTANTYEPAAYSNTSVLSPRTDTPTQPSYVNSNAARPLPTISDSMQRSEAFMFREGLRRQEGPIPPNAFVKLQLLGEGAFGAVYQGALKDGDRLWPVAVKEMKSSNPEDMDTFRAEANLMKHLSHPNVVSCIGATATTPLYILLELMPLGDLAGHLQKSKKKGKVISAAERIWYGYQIARGMAYLSGQGIVHRDLAARNCMLAEPSGCVGFPVVKISDFGLSRQVDSDHDYYRMESTGKVPVPWLAPETLKERVFSERTDVWAYGITMWEVWTDCSDMPYAGTGINLFSLVAELDRGYRLPQPPSCPPHMYSLMRACWAADSTARPTFSSLSATMAEMFVPVSPTPVQCRVVDGETVLTEVLDRHGYVAMDQYDYYARMQSEGTEAYLNSPYIKEDQLKVKTTTQAYDTPSDTMNPSPQLPAQRKP